MWLFVGLGNPGEKYRANRHNIGFMAIDRIAKQYNIQDFRSKFQGLAAQGTIADEKVVLLKPQTFMNESGRSVGEAARFHKISLEKIVVFHDELDVATGKVKVKTGGGAAGHNGLKSIDAHIGKDYRRIRIGIGHPGDKSRVHGYVLSDFYKKDHEWLEDMLSALADNVEILLQNDQGKYMSKVAQASHNKNG